MRQLSISLTLGLLCVAAWIIAAPYLAEKKSLIEKEKIENQIVESHKH